MNRTIHTVGQINSYLQTMMDSDELLSGLFIRGEISNYKLYPSGHHYFSLKDETGAIKCVLFRSSAFRLRFRPANGMKVIAAGRVSVYPRDGVYQLYCTGLMADGVGDLYVAFEQLKARLMAEGLFDEQHKKALPPYPERIAIVTSPSGAAIHDMLRILSCRYPLAHVRILPVRVQGTEAPAEIAAAIDYANRWKLADVLLVGRGGGSMEDLWAFNDERVARAIYRSVTPVISAVGHEPDVTISDYVADLRAATPSNAAELVVPDCAVLRKRLTRAAENLGTATDALVRSMRQKLDLLSAAKPFRTPTGTMEDKRQALDHLTGRMETGMKQVLTRYTSARNQAAMALDALSPLQVLGRGYAIVSDEHGRPLRTVSNVQAGSTLLVTVADGGLKVTVNAVSTREGGNNLGEEESKNI